MDGVLFDSEPIHIQFEELLFKKMSINLSESHKKKIVGLGDYKMWEMLKESFRLNDSLQQLLINDRKERTSFFRKNRLTIMPGAEKLLKLLNSNGFRLSLASSSQMDLIDLNLSRSGFDHFFEVKVSNDMVKSGKPDPDIFLFTAAKMNVSPQNCLVIEDSDNGVKAAKSAGMKCIRFLNRHDLNQDVGNADITINDLLNITPELIKSFSS